MTSTATFKPDWISPPGETIEDLLEERGWTQAELATRTSFTSKHVNDLVKGRATLTPDTAQRLALVLGSTTDFWLVREAHYRARLEETEQSKAFLPFAKWLKELPIGFMRKKGWVRSFRDPGAQVSECLLFFNVASVEAWRERYEAPLAAYRASPKLKRTRGAVAAWLRRAEREAEALRTEPFQLDAFLATLERVRSLTRETDLSRSLPDLVRRCAACGVAVVVVEAPPGCPVSGATRWMAPDKALLVLSLRHKTDDHLWFTFFHEAGHLTHHGKRIQFVDGVDGLNKEQEAEADRFAAETLIPSKHILRLRKLRSEADVVSFGDDIGIAPGIVVGRMQREGVIPWSHLNKLKRRVSFPA